MPRQYSERSRERVVALLQMVRDVTNLANELEIVVATLDRWQRQARIGAGAIGGVNSEVG